MSNSILRRKSSKQGLQNLLRVTAQRSVEDAEETERERRRRAREREQGQRATGGPTPPPSIQGPSPCPTPPPSMDEGRYAADTLCDSELKAGCQVVLEEDEGFSDWTQKLERRKQRHLEEQDARDEHRPKLNGTSRPSPKSSLVAGPREQEGERRELAGRDRHHTPQAQSKSIDHKDTEQKKEVKISYTSKVFMPQDTRHLNTNGDTAERTTYLVAGKMSPSRRSSSLAGQSEVDGEVEEAFSGREQQRTSVEKFRRSRVEAEEEALQEERGLEEQQRSQAEEEHGLEEQQWRQVEEQQKSSQRRDDRRWLVEEDQHRWAQEEEGRVRKRDEVEKRRVEAAERRMKTLSISSSEGDETPRPFSPRSPAFKDETEERVMAENTCSITERTESLNRSLMSSSNARKCVSPVAVSKIDNRLEQYTHAIEVSSKEAKTAKQALMDLPCPPEPVAAKKSLFEAREAWGQSCARGTPSKDAEGIKVGVADLISQWVKGNPDDTCKGSSSKPAEINPGDVLSKKNLWETLGDTPSSKGKGKEVASGKRFRFVVTGHGKYEKIDDKEDFDEYSSRTSTGQCHENW